MYNKTRSGQKGNLSKKDSFHKRSSFQCQRKIKSDTANVFLKLEEGVAFVNFHAQEV